jgi:tetratricopeptide (TPR) repeat protein
MLTAIDPAQFVSTVRPLLENQDVKGLIHLLKDRWSCDQIATLLMGDDEDVRKVAALCLALVGKRCTIDKIVERLKDSDPMVNQMAEHALWSIWFRCGNQQANTELCRGTKALNARNFETAMEHFDRAIAIDEDFAEAYNQRAIAHYLQERYFESIADARRAVEKMPCHFGALAGMGHCHLNLGDLPKALKCYEQALSINPHLDCLNQTVSEIRSRLNDEGRA